MTPQRGFALISAIFILVVLAALGAFIVSISTSQQVGAALDVQGVRAYQAARSGIEWGLYRQLQETQCASVASFVPAAPTLAGFSVTVTCAQVQTAPDVFNLVATACNQPTVGWSATTAACPNAAPGAGYVERQVTVSF